MRATFRIAATLRMLLALASATLAFGLASLTSADAAPRPDSPGGATATLDQATIAPGGSLSFSGTGWTTTASTATGAVIGGIKLDDVDQLNTTPVVAQTNGSMSGRVTLPATVSAGEHWLRFLSGTDQPGDPVRSLHASFTVVAASDPGGAGATATPTPTPPGSGGAGGTGTLPKTGMDLRDGVWWAAGLAAAAALLVGYGRLRTRRRRA